MTMQSMGAARSLAPEDISPGDYVTCVWMRHQVVAGGFMCAGDPRVIDLEYCPPDIGTPKLVVAVCLPFVLVRTPGGTHESLDVRRVRLMRLGAGYGRTAFDRLAQDDKGDDADED